MHLRSFLPFLATFACFYVSSQPAPVEPVSVILQRSPNPTDPPVVVFLKITNNGNQPIILSDRAIPFSFEDQPLPPNQFAVTNEDGSSAPYIGNYPYLIEDVNTMPRLGPHQSVNGLVDLRRTFAFDHQGTDKRTIVFTLQLGILPDDLTPKETDPAYATNPNRPRAVSSAPLAVRYRSGKASVDSVPERQTQ